MAVSTDYIARYPVEVVLRYDKFLQISALLDASLSRPFTNIVQTQINWSRLLLIDFPKWKFFEAGTAEVQLAFLNIDVRSVTKGTASVVYIIWDLHARRNYGARWGLLLSSSCSSLNVRSIIYCRGEVGDICKTVCVSRFIVSDRRLNILIMAVWGVLLLCVVSYGSVVTYNQAVFYVLTIFMSDDSLLHLLESIIY